jgi:hypothetical protein
MVFFVATRVRGGHPMTRGLILCRCEKVLSKTFRTALVFIPFTLKRVPQSRPFTSSAEVRYEWSNKSAPTYAFKTACENF